MFSKFFLRHITSLFVATALTLGGLLPFFSAEYTIRESKLPERPTVSQPAQSIMILLLARGTAIGLALFASYFQGKYRAVDTVMATLGYVGLIDGYVCWNERVPGKAVFREMSGAVIAGWGLFGLMDGK